MDYITLEQTLYTSVAELKFARKRPRPGDSPTRRMLCTLDKSILESELGLSVLNFKPANNPPKYNPASKGLICVWDIFVQDWRMVNTQNCSIISTIPTEKPEVFWQYFNDIILPMTPATKAAFINT